MKLESTSYRVTIHGDIYTFISDESSDHLNAAAALVDRYMNEISTRMPTLEKHKVAVLAAMRIASQKIHLERDIEQTKIKQAHLIDDVDHLLKIT